MAERSTGLSTPICPRWLDPEAKAEWKRIAPELKRLGILTVLDGPILAAYCESVGLLRHAATHLRKEGAATEVYAVDKGATPACGT